MSFKRSLQQGQLGEAMFLDAHSSLEQTDGRKHDFIVNEDCSLWNKGDTLELKTDFYNYDSTPNFFLERWSNMDTKAPGGPWQAKKNGTTHFVYFFTSALVYFSFNVEKLVKWLEANEPSFVTRKIQNKSWTTLGYLVPRHLLTNLYTQGNLRVVKDKRKKQ